MTDERIVNLLFANGLPVAGVVEHCTPETADIYYPANYLIFVERGILRLEAEGAHYEVRSGECILVKKFTHASYYKNWEENQDGFREVIFVLLDDYIKEIIQSFPLPENGRTSTRPVIKIRHSTVLEGLMRSLEVYIDKKIALDKPLLIMKTREALHGILQAKPELIHAFIDFTQPQKADLLHFMEHSFTQNISLEQFARLSGRSLATFNRDFRKVFQMPPYQWIKQQRLARAKHLLTYTNKTPSVVYLEVGFEDLAYFSRSFKQQFGINPSAVEKRVE